MKKATHCVFDNLRGHIVFRGSENACLDLMYSPDSAKGRYTVKPL